LRRRAGDPDDLLLRSATLVATLLTINNYHYRRGGADVAYLDQSDLFRRKGWEVASFSMTHPQNLPSPWSSYFVKEIEFGSDYSPLRVLENSVKSIYSLEAAAKVRELVRKVRPNIAHAHNVYHHLSPSVLGAIKAEGVPLFMTLHDLKLLCPSRTMWTHGQICEACKGGRLRNVVKRRCMKGSLALSSLIYEPISAMSTSSSRRVSLYWGSFLSGDGRRSNWCTFPTSSTLRALFRTSRPDGHSCISAG
jgi:hypothetical protein